MRFNFKYSSITLLIILIMLAFTTLFHMYNVWQFKESLAEEITAYYDNKESLNYFTSLPSLPEMENRPVKAVTVKPTKNPYDLYLTYEESEEIAYLVDLEYSSFFFRVSLDNISFTKPDSSVGFSSLD